MTTPYPRSHFITTGDGLRLHVRAYGPQRGDALPVVCLPGLARTGDDFEPLGLALASGQKARRVLALDYRGRGQSDFDPDTKRYDLLVEMADVLSVMTATDALPAIIVGTSRGGLIAMLMAAARPGAIAGCVLNDIGPVLEPAGLIRIKSYVGKLPAPRDFAHAAEILRQHFGAQFPRQDETGWALAARRMWREESGKLILRYDPALGRALDAFDPAKPLPALWAQFDALEKVPVLAIRGALSDLLSQETVRQMKVRRPDLETLEVAHEGHAPLLADAKTIQTIRAFADRCGHPAA